MRYFYSFLFLLGGLFFSWNSLAQYKTLEFIENKGQWEGPHQYLASTEIENIYLEKNAITYSLSDAKNLEYIKTLKDGGLKDGTVFKYHTYKVTFAGANTQCEIIPGKKERHYYNYFLGNNPEKWQTEIHPARVLDYKAIYPGVDMHISSENQQLKYEFILAAGADPSQIIMRYDGQEQLSLSKGNLIIKTSVGEVKELKPYTYQLINGEKKEIACHYQVKGNEVSFFFPKGYDKSSLLVIDPTVVFATFTGATADNWGFTATYDQSGNFYAGGIVSYIQPTNSFPTSLGAFQTVYNGGSTTTNTQYPCDIVVFKYNAVGNAYLFATFLGGTNNEQPHSLVVDAANNLIVAGRTYSANYPVKSDSYDTSYNGGADIIITKLNATGTALLGSTYIGGSGDDGVNENAGAFVQGVLKHNFGDDARSEVIIDNAANVYMAASTVSANFPITSNAFQSSLQGGQDGVIIKLNNNLSNLIWSTYLGGSSNDGAYVLALNKQQSHLYVGGGTRSANFPITLGTLNPTYIGGTVDGFICRFNNSGTYGLDKTTFIGTTNYDQCYGLQIDDENSVYAMGQTLGGTFPVTPGVYSNAGSSQFVIKLDSLLATNVYSTVFGSSNSTQTNISPVAFLVDTCQNVYISGWGGNLGGATFTGIGTTLGMYTSSGAIQTVTDGSDFYFFVLAKNAISPLYATFYGGNGAGEHVDGGTSRFDKNGVVYQALCGGCGGNSNFPTTAGSVSTINGSANCNIAAIKMAFELGVVNALALANPDTVGCAPFLVNFSNGSTNATSYSWDFGDGGSSTLATPSHTYLNPGNYTVRMIANNPNACKVSDTVYLQVVVINNSILPAFQFSKIDSCSPYSALLTNTSIIPPVGTTTFHWDFGDGTTSTLQNPPLHTFPDTGCYTIRLILTNPQACKSPDTIIHKICYQVTTVTAAMTIPDTLCINMPGQFSSNAINAQSIQWDFGDGTSGSMPNTSHTYSAPGLYTVRLIATNLQACIPKDTVTKQLYVSNNIIHADFQFTKIDTCKPFTATFQNTSAFGTTTGAQVFTKFNWDFGDGTTSTLQHPPLHAFPDSGCYDVRLIMVDTTACNTPDTVIKRICFDATIVVADFLAPDTVCQNNGVLFSDRSKNATSYQWIFGDGQTSNATSPVHAFQAAGTYSVTLIVGNPNSCNKFDTITYSITVRKLPVADFIHRPLVPVGNELTVFTNRSKDAISYIWDFGDGTGSNEKDPSHQYKRTKTYLVCLTAIDDKGCADTICKSVDALVIPAIGVPTAFSPNGDGANDILYVYGAAVESFTFKLYNRWGQLLFETTDLTKGWDGLYKGKPQEMDSYAYTLQANFYDGTTASKEGNVTLLR